MIENEPVLIAGDKQPLAQRAIWLRTVKQSAIASG